MLTEEAVREIIETKSATTEFVTVAMVQAIAEGLVRMQDPKTSPSAIAQLIEVLRKTRADLTGDSAQLNVPQMMVNIQFDKNVSALQIAGKQPVTLENLVGNTDE